MLTESRAAHLRWESEDGQNLDYVCQQLRGNTLPPEPIPASKLLLLTLNRTGIEFRRSWSPPAGVVVVEV